MASGNGYTPYLHLAYGDDAAKNRNWDILDGKALDIARELFANIPAGGDLQGFYPDPTIRDGAVGDAQISDVSWSKLTGTPPNLTGLWQDNGTDLVPVDPTRGVTLTGTDDPLVWGRSLEKGRLSETNLADNAWAGITINWRNGSAQDNPLRPSWGAYVRCDFGDQFLVQRVGPGGGLPIALLAVNADGRVRVTVDPIAPLDLATKQYVDASGGGGDTLWLSDTSILKPVDPTVWAVQLPAAGTFIGGSSPSDCGSLRLEPSAITLLCTSNGSTFDVVMDGGAHIIAADSSICTINGFLFADGIELDTTIRLGPSGPAPSDGTLQYTGTTFQGRVAGAWVDIPGTGGGGGIADAPSDGLTYNRRNAAWTPEADLNLTVDIGSGPFTGTAYNTIIGAQTGGTGGTSNTFVGCRTATGMNSGARNVALGYGALAGSNTGNDNVAIGQDAGAVNNTNFAVALGSGAQAKFDYAVALGAGAQAAATYEVVLGTATHIVKVPGRSYVAANPVDPLEVATKQYVDANAGGGAVGPDRTTRTLAGGTTALDGTAAIYYASAISNATLPLASSCPGRTYTFAPANQINLSRSGSDTIVVGTAAGVASLAITANMRVTVISDGISAWRVIAADPALSITGIVATGSLSGTYPNPSIASGAVGAVHLQSAAVQPNKLAGITPVSPTDAGKIVFLDHTNPNTQWKLLGTTSPVIESTGVLALPAGDVKLGASGVLKTRVQSNPSTGGIFANRDWLATNAQDDATKASWGIQLNPVTDNIVFQRSPAGSTTQTNLMTLNGTGGLAMNGDVYVGTSAVFLNSTHASSRGLVQAYAFGGSTIAELSANQGQIVAAKPVWTLRLDAAASVEGFHLLRQAPSGGATTSPLVVDGAGNMTILGATATKATGTTWANPSDRRLKDDIDDYGPGLESLMFLRPRTFIYNGRGGSQAGLRGYGFIADEVEPTFPEMVRAMRGKLDPDDDEETDIAVLDSSNLVLVLVNAVKELAARVAALEAP